MFFRIKKSGNRGYVQVVENRRVDGTVRQSVIANLGRADELIASGGLASLLASGAKLTDQVLVINAFDEDGDGSLSAAARRIGGPLLFGRIWQRLGIADVLEELLEHRAFEFPVERAVFVGTLHRLFVSGSDRDCSAWMEDYDIAGVDGLALHHFYRAMAWLGEEVAEKAADALAPRCVKDVIEEQLFDRRRDLFTDLSAVFMDTTSLSFYGEGGATDLSFFRRRHSRSRLLFVPGPDHAEIPGRPLPRGRRRVGMEDPSARSRSPAAAAHPPSRQPLAGADRRCQADRGSVPPRSHRAAAARQADGATQAGAAQEIRPQTPRPPSA